MRSLFIDYSALQRNDRQIKVRDQRQQVNYLITGQWGNQLGRISVCSIYGDELLTINQVTANKIQKFEIIQDHRLISTFKRLVYNYDRPLYLSKLHWFVWGNLKQMRYYGICFHRFIMKTSLTSEIPQFLKLQVNQSADEPLCAGLVVFLNYYATLDQKLYQKQISPELSHQNELA